MNAVCPDCSAIIPLADVNVSTDVALCRPCSKTFSFATLLDDTMPDVDLAKPPRGAWVRTLGGGFEVGSTARSALAFFLVPFTLLWSGGSLFVIYGSQFWKGQFDSGMSLFGIPFLLGSLVLIPAALMAAFGKIVVRIDGDQASLFRGIGRVGWTKRFRWSTIRRVLRSKSTWTQNDRHLPLIEMQSDGASIRFGTQLSETRRDFLLAVLKRRLAA